jgi:O-antigen/teichoic acid export membrane protein
MPSTTSDNTPATRGFAAQLPRNLAANIAYFLVNIVIGILLVPYFIDTLGVAAYGLIPLATSITGYVAIVVLSLNITVTRFLIVELQRENYAVVKLSRPPPFSI